MSLAISVGILAGASEPDPETLAWDRKGLQHANRVLAEHGLPLHHEPESLPDFPYRGQLISFPYDWTPYLYRAVAFARRAPAQFCPVRKGDNPAQDQRVEAELYTFAESHLICHSDTEGYFVPIDFPDVLCDHQKNGLPGRLLGSSQQVLRELVLTAPLLDIPLNGRDLSDAGAKQIASEPDESHPCWIERKVWLSFYEAFRLSVEHKCAVAYG